MSAGARAPGGQRPAQHERSVLGVGQLLAGLRHLLEDRVGRVWVVGEVSNLFEAASGHAYFTLKDDAGQVRSVLFRGTARRLPFQLEEGMEILVHAEVSIYEARGDLQLIVRHLEPRGAGALQLALEQLRTRLEAEGLFEDARKRAVPAFPKRLGVVTSPHGAAVRDVIRVSAERFPSTPILVSPTRVQGEGSEHEIVEALQRVVRQPDVDVVLLVRGGGSLEDLWSFNSEAVVRAVVACPVPVICGVGHEVDVTLADLAADLRVPTPSAAALAALPDARTLDARRVQTERALGRALRVRLSAARATLRSERDALRALDPAVRLRAQAERVARLADRLRRATERGTEHRRLRARAAGLRLQPRALAVERLRARLAPLARSLAGLVGSGNERRRARLGTFAARLDSLSPLAVLGRGYALARRADDGRVVREAGDVRAGDALTVRVARAEIDARVDAVRRLAGSSDD